MKNTKSIIGILLIIIPFVLCSQPLPYDNNGGEGLAPAGGFGISPVLHWKLTNPYVYDNGTNKVFAFDIEIASSLPDTYHNNLFVSLSFNALAFGTNVVANNKVDYEFLDLTLPITSYTVNGMTDLATNKFGFYVKAITNNTNNLKEVPEEPQYGGLVHLEIDITDINQKAGISFNGTQMNMKADFITATCLTPAYYGSLPGFVNVYENDLTQTDLEPGLADWTWIFYIQESNLNARDDLNELEHSASKWGKINYIAYFDSKTDPGPPLQEPHDGIYYLKKDPKAGMAGDKIVSHRIRDGVDDMTQAPVLYNFLKNDIATNFPAQKYGLIFWNHGDGIFKDGEGKETDGIFGDFELWEVDDALKQFTIDVQKIDVLGFDMCLMAWVETVNMMKDYAEVVIASELPGISPFMWNFKEPFIQMNDNLNWDANQISNAIVNETLTHYVGLHNQGKGDYDFTLSATSTNIFDNNFLPDLFDFADKLILHIDDLRHKYFEARSFAWYPKYCPIDGNQLGICFNHKMTSFLNERDIGSFARYFINEPGIPQDIFDAASKILISNEFSESVFAKKQTDFANEKGYNISSTGLKIWFPNNIQNFPDQTGTYIDINKLDFYNSWFDFLQKMVIKCNLKVFLEGPFNGTSMYIDLTDDQLVGYYQPFNGPPWNYDGDEEIAEIIDHWLANGNAIIADEYFEIVDWVLVEIRESDSGPENATSGTIVSRQAALLRFDGVIVDPFTFEQFNLHIPTIGNYYVVIHHRNHLSVMSNEPMTFDPATDTYSFDFTSDYHKTYQGLNAIKVKSGKCVMIAGNGNSDKDINNGDKNGVYLPQAGFGGYLNGDFNLDGEVNAIDKNDCWNPNVGRGSQVPE